MPMPLLMRMRMRMLCLNALQIYRMALLISLVVGDCEKIKTLVRKHMVEKYGRVGQIRANCPTRFSIAHMICVDILENKEALRAAIVSGEWEAVARSSTNADAFKEYVLGEGGRQSSHSERILFWVELHALVGLGQPFCDAIHQLEGDQPMLSQLLPIWQKLLQHVDEFVLKRPEPKWSVVKTSVDNRFEKQCGDAVYAAYAPDPMFSSASGDSMLLPLMLLSEAEREKAQEYLERFVSESEHDDLEQELTSVAMDRPLHLNKYL
eukprot:349849-Chlamydomonas_euryale.AAC.2